MSTGPDGTFRLALSDGAYRVRVSFIGYLANERTVTVAGAPIDLGRIVLRQDTTELGETFVEAIETRVTVRGDTTAYNAAAFSVNPDATAGDLIQKLPGVTVQDGEVQAGGEAVQRVLVDGKEFFGDDPTTALDNLPAAAVQEVQVYDRASDRAELTGFDDGEEQRTINIVTKPEHRRSVFGRAHAGVGSDLRYAAGGTLNLFEGARRATAYARADNVDSQTLLGLQGEDRPSGTMRFWDGITRTTSAGATYSDEWGDDVEINANYSLSASDNTRDVTLAREYVLSEAAGQRYAETTAAGRDDLYHDFGARIEAQLSERTELRLRPSLGVATHGSDSRLAAQTALPTGGLLSRTQTLSLGDGADYDAGLRGTIAHKFETEGRTLSGDLRLGTEGYDGDDTQDIERVFYLPDGVGVDSVDAFGRQVRNDRGERTASGEIAYSEPLAEGWQALVTYAPSLSVRATDREAFRLDAGGQETVLDSAFTSFTDQRVMTHSAGANVQRKTETLTATVGLAVAHERLTFEQAGPRAFDASRTTAWLRPSARIDYQTSEQSRIRFVYFASTDTPSVTQLRDEIDDSNPLQVSAGNPDLETARTHYASLQLRTADPEAGTNLSGTVRLRVVQDYIGQATLTSGADPATLDLVRFGDVTLLPGGRLTYPVNLGGYVSLSSYLSHGRPLPALQSNLNAFVALSYSRTPTLIDGLADRADAASVSARLFLGSNASERFDLSVSYGVNARLTWYSAEGGARRTSYASHQGGLNLDWRPTGGLVVRSNLDASYTPSVGAGLDPLAARLDLGLGYTFLAADRAEARLTLADVFDRSAQVGRRVTDLYIEDRETLSLGRFVLLGLSYTIRPAGGAPPSGDRGGRRGPRGPRGGH